MHRQLEAETTQARLAAEARRKVGMHQKAEAFGRAVGGIIAPGTAADAELQSTAQTLTATATQIAQVQASKGRAVTEIGSITTRIQEISGVAISIAAAVEEQGAATQKIVRNVGQAAQGTGSVTHNITAVAEAADQTDTATS